MESNTRLVIQHMLESMLDDIRDGRCNIDESEGLTIIESLKDVLYPKPKSEYMNITQCCAKLGISQPTFRKYIKQGIIEDGYKIEGFVEKVWTKEYINTIDYVSKNKR